MKTLISKSPVWLNVLLYFLVLWFATFLAGIFPVLNDFIFFLCVSLLMSWLFLRAQGQSLRTLGFIPSGKRDWKDLFTGAAGGCIILIIVAVITLVLTNDKWTINRYADPVYVVISFMMCWWSAFVQEFVFRGYPFQALLKQYGIWVAQLVTVIPFGLMHVNGSMNIQDILAVMLTTGLGSVLFGLAYFKTGKLHLPVGLHLGWNYAQQMIPRTAGGNDKGLVIVTGDPAGYNFYTVLLPYILVMGLSILLLAFTKKEVQNNKL